MINTKKEKKIGALLISSIFLIIAVSLTVPLVLRYHTLKNWSYDSKTTATLIAAEKTHVKTDSDYYKYTYSYKVDNEYFTIIDTGLSEPKYGQKETILYNSACPGSSIFSTGIEAYQQGTKIFLYITLAAYGIFILSAILSFFYIQSLHNKL